jgi:two-component system, response regulator RegA
VSEFRLRALVIEDDQLLSRSLRELLGDWGFDAGAAFTLAEGFEALREDWTVLLLDLGLSDGSGLKVASELANRAKRPLTIAITGTATAEEAFQLARFGVRAYLPKPLNLADLRETLRVVLEESAGAAADLESLVRAEVGTVPYHDLTARVRRAMVERALQLAGGSKTGAARILRVSRQAVQQLIRSLEVSKSTHD